MLKKQLTYKFSLIKHTKKKCEKEGIKLLMENTFTLAWWHFKVVSLSFHVLQSSLPY